LDKIVTETSDGENSPAVREKATFCVASCSRVKDNDVLVGSGELTVGSKTVNDVAGSRVLRIALTREHHRHRRAAGRGDGAGEAALGRAK
jgi:hypothetical protein